MKRIIYLITSITIFTIGCSSKKEKKVDFNQEVNKNHTKTEPVPYSFIRPFDGYFAKSKVNKITELNIDSIQFAKEFQFAATMNNKPITIDFLHERIGAIILPESAYDTQIVLDTNFVKNDTLHVVYQINKGKEKRSFTTVPIQLFTYNAKFNLKFNCLK